MENYVRKSIGAVCAISACTYVAMFGTNLSVQYADFGSEIHIETSTALASIKTQKSFYASPTPELRLSDIRLNQKTKDQDLSLPQKPAPEKTQSPSKTNTMEPTSPFAERKTNMQEASTHIAPVIAPTAPSIPVSEAKTAPKPSPIDAPQLASYTPRNIVPVTGTRPGNISGTKEIRFDRPQRIRQWGEVYYRQLGQTNDLKHCVNNTQLCTDPVLANWANRLRQLKNLAPRQRMQAVNNLVNQRQFRLDSIQYGQSDYWAAPNEFLTAAGDCEDYALLKFASLMALDFTNEDMRLVVGNITGIGSHAFLSVKMDGQEWLLDNRTAHISRAALRNDFQPKHSMNFTHRWVHIQKGKTVRST